MTKMSNLPRDLATKSLRTVRSLSKAHESMADLPQDLAEEVLTRLPTTSLASVRSSCKTWNTLSKDSSFTTKHLCRQATAKDEFTLVLMMDYEIHLLRFDLDNDVFMLEGTLLNLNCTDQIDVCEVFHCYGLLLCISQDNTRLVVWNPYWGQSRWIEPTHSFDRLDCYVYALGYDTSSNSHKILSFTDYKITHHADYDAPPTSVTFAEYEIYEFSSHSWRFLDVTIDCIIDDHCRVSIKGNTYWFAKSNALGRDSDCCLLCFDFTREIFGAPLPLPPFVWHSETTIALSSVREEQLAMLFQRRSDELIEIWVTTKIEPDTVSWSSKVFLAVNITNFRFPFTGASFFIDEEKKVVVVFGKDTKGLMDHTCSVAYIVGVDGSLKIVHLGNSPQKYCFPRVCPYVPTLVQP